MIYFTVGSGRVGVVGRLGCCVSAAAVCMCEYAVRENGAHDEIIIKDGGVTEEREMRWKSCSKSQLQSDGEGMFSISKLGYMEGKAPQWEPGPRNLHCLFNFKRARVYAEGKIGVKKKEQAWYWKDRVILRADLLAPGCSSLRTTHMLLGNPNEQTMPKASFEIGPFGSI